MSAAFALEFAATQAPQVESCLARGCRHELFGVTEDFKMERIFFIHGHSSFRQPAVQELLTQELNSKLAVEFQDFAVNPQAEDLLRAYELFQGSACDSILVIGGGTAMDLGKMLAELVSTMPLDSDSSQGLEMDGLLAALNSDSRPLFQSVPLVLMPTTSGSGAEATHFSVLYLQGVKHSIARPSPNYGPVAALVDSALSDSMPLRLRASCGLDVLCQAAESLWAKEATEESKRWAREALELCWSNLKPSMDEQNIAARDAMARAAHLAGRAINQSKTTAAHALSYGLSAQYGVSHGHAVALMFGPVMFLNAKGGDKQAQELMEFFGVANDQEPAQAFLEFVASLGLETSLTKLGVPDEASRIRLAQGVNTERLENNPVALNSEDLQWIFASLA